MYKQYALFILLVAEFAFASMAHAQTCRIPPGPMEFPAPDHFWASSPKECPASTPIYDQPINESVESATTLDCIQMSTNSISCVAYPQEYVTGGELANHLIYEWTVRINFTSYTYPPNFDPMTNFGCANGDKIFVTMRVWNGSSSSQRTSGFTCGNEAY